MLSIVINLMEKIEWDNKIPETLNNRWITWKQLWSIKTLLKYLDRTVSMTTTFP